MLCLSLWDLGLFQQNSQVPAWSNMKVETSLAQMARSVSAFYHSLQE